MIDFRLNLFGFHDPDAGDGGSNWIQDWEKEFRDSENVTFWAINSDWDEHV